METHEPMDLWAAVEVITARLDAANGTGGDTELALRFLKLAEETGEASAALLGMLGQNPRKGVTHTRNDVAAELCDVIVAAAVTLTTLVSNPDDARAFLEQKLKNVPARGESAPPARP